MRMFPPLIFCLLIACSSQNSGNSTATSQDIQAAKATSPWTIIPLKGKWKDNSFEVTAKGEVFVNGKVHARFIDNELRNASGATLAKPISDTEFTFEPPEEFAKRMPHISKHAKYDGKNELRTEAGGHIYVTDEGIVKWKDGEGEANAPLVVEGFTPNMKREILLLQLLFMRDF